MIHVTIGTKLSVSFKLVCWQMICAFVCICFFSACNEKETITDVYYIHNGSSQIVVLDFETERFWDTCSVYSTTTYTHVEVGKQAEIPPGKTIRLHPIFRKYDNPKTHQLDATFVGWNVKFICGTDTLTWQAVYKQRPPGGYYCMFTDDYTWSIFNTTCWETEQDAMLPYTYYHTFSITDSHIERN